ncbi:hypothetical protein CDIK_3542 [Cucumispora dikerogammari]|nr:hypothetical protein CDIK_3542 [Cucumispora dikerogammari]
MYSGIQIYEKSSFASAVFSYLASSGLLKNNLRCSGCRKTMRLEFVENGDSVIWRCRSLRCNNKVVSVRKDSVFFNMHIPLKIIFLIIYEWSLNSRFKDIITRLGVGYKAINSVLSEIRKKIIKLKFEKIGGSKCIIEIDETAVTKHKFERGRRVSTLWCVEGVCKVHKSFFFELTKKKDIKPCEQYWIDI